MIKYYINILFLTIASFNCIAQENSEEKEEYDHHCHFEDRSLNVGIGLTNALNIGSPGINVRMYYNVSEKICFGPEYSYFNDGDLEVIDFDFVGHYIFETKLVGIYPLVGVNYSVEKEEHLDEEEIHESFGAVFGAGVHRSFKRLTVFAEYTRVEFGVNEQFITFGVMRNFR